MKKKALSVALLMALAGGANAQLGDVFKQLKKAAKDIEAAQTGSDSRTGTSSGGNSTQASSNGAMGMSPGIDDYLQQLQEKSLNESLAKGKRVAVAPTARQYAYEMICGGTFVQPAWIVAEAFNGDTNIGRKIDNGVQDATRFSQTGGQKAKQDQLERCQSDVAYLREKIRNIAADIDTRVKTKAIADANAKEQDGSNKIRDDYRNLITKKIESLKQVVDESSANGYAQELTSTSLEFAVSLKTDSPSFIDNVCGGRLNHIPVVSRFAAIEQRSSPSQPTNDETQEIARAIEQAKNAGTDVELCKSQISFFQNETKRYGDQARAILNKYMDERLKRYNALKSGAIPLATAADYVLLYRPEDADGIVKQPLLKADQKVYAVAGKLIQAEGDKWLFHRERRGIVGKTETKVVERVTRSQYQERTVGSKEIWGSIDDGMFRADKSTSSKVNAQMRLNANYVMVGQYVDNAKVKAANGTEQTIPVLKVMFIADN